MSRIDAIADGRVDDCLEPVLRRHPALTGHRKQIRAYVRSHENGMSRRKSKHVLRAARDLAHDIAVAGELAGGDAGFEADSGVPVGKANADIEAGAGDVGSGRSSTVLLPLQPVSRAKTPEATARARALRWCVMV